MRVLFLLAFIATVHSAVGSGGPCGGLLEANAGEYKFQIGESKVILEQGKVCVWIVKSISRQNIQFNLTELGEGLTVSLYPQPSTDQLTIQATRLTSSDNGTSVNTEGQTLVVVLAQNGTGQGFAFNWKSLASTSVELLTGGNYVNQESGQVLWNAFSNPDRLTLSLNSDQSGSLDVEANSDFGECNLVNQCQCSYVALYEITKDGYLREVAVSCGRPSEVKVRKLFPNILAFVFLNSTNSNTTTDFAEIKWTPTPTAPGPVNITNECGGAVQFGNEGTIIKYLPPGGYKYNEFCIWTLEPKETYRGYSIDYKSLGMEKDHDGIIIYTWDREGSLATRRIEPSHLNSTYLVDQPYAAVAFASDSNSQKLGFEMTIKGTGHLEGGLNSRGFVLNQTDGNFSYPEDFGVRNYKPNETVAVFLQNAYATTTLDVDFTDIQDDSITLYELNRYCTDNATAKLVGRATGSNPEGDPVLHSISAYPRLVLFNSNDNSNTGKGFSMSWSRRTSQTIPELPEVKNLI